MIYSNSNNRILIISLVLAAAFCLLGINWGRVESWNVDQIAIGHVTLDSSPPLKPSNYLKPSFHSYLNLFLAELPSGLIRKLLGLPPIYYYSFSLIASRLLTALLFCGCTLLIFLISKEIFTIQTANILSLVFASSAGVVAFAHFLTADIPVTFWMLLAFYFSQKILRANKLSFYLAAGFLTGLATGTKYNGLAVGISIPIAHILSQRPFTFKKAILDMKLVLGLMMVPLGFVISNPYTVVDTNRFLQDFMYNYYVTPAWDGATSGSSYLVFFQKFAEIFGLPYCIAIAFSAFLFLIDFKNKYDSMKIRRYLLLFSVFLVYYLKFAPFPRMETRFVLPIAPYLFILSGILWERITSRKVTMLLIILLLGYNIICSALVGWRFLMDPRMQAQEWVRAHIPCGLTILNSPQVPNWNRLPGVNVKIVEQPHISGRERLLNEIFKENQSILDYIKQTRRMKDDQKLAWYTLQKVRTLNPDYICLDSLHYEIFTNHEPIGRLYPNVKKFFCDILSGIPGYRTVFEKDNYKHFPWAYPQSIDFLENRIIIFGRKDLFSKKPYERKIDPKAFQYQDTLYQRED